MPRDLQAFYWVRTGILSLVLAMASHPVLLAQKHPASTGAPAAATPPEVDWLQTLASLFGPSLTTAIRQGRERAYPHGGRIPEVIRRTLAPSFSRTVLQQVRYSTAWRAATAQDTLSS